MYCLSLLVDENESDFVYLLNVIEDNREIPSIRSGNNINNV